MDAMSRLAKWRQTWQILQWACMFSTQQSTTHHLILLITFSLVQRVPISEITRLQVNVELVDVFFYFCISIKKKDKNSRLHMLIYPHFYSLIWERLQQHAFLYTSRWCSLKASFIRLFLSGKQPLLSNSTPQFCNAVPCRQNPFSNTSPEPQKTFCNCSPAVWG